MTDTPASLMTSSRCSKIRPVPTAVPILDVSLVSYRKPGAVTVG